MPRGDKRDAILRAAIRTFARSGFFGAQVADVARTAGVAAGTVYLYFRSKDDLLVSIFERVMSEAIAEGRAALAGIADPLERLRRIAHLHLDRLSRDRDLAIVFQVELRQTTKFMERFSNTLLRDYLGILRDVIAEGQAAGVVRPGINPTLAAKMLFGALDEMATNWMLSHRRYVARRRRRRRHRRLRARRRRARRRREGPPMMRTVTVLGAGTMGAQIAAHAANAGFDVQVLDVSADAARDGMKRAAALRPDPFFTRAHAHAVRTGSFDDRPRRRLPRRLGDRGGGRAPRRQAGAVRARRRRPRAAHHRHLEHLGHPDRRARRRPQRRRSAATSSARTSSTRRATSSCSS